MNRPPLRNVYAGEFPAKKGSTTASPQERYEMYILEEKPSQHLYSYLNSVYRLWMPWTYYVMKLAPWKETGVVPSFQRILWAPDQIRFTDEHFYSPGIPNLGQGDGIPCFAQSKSISDPEEMEKLAGQYGSIFDWAMTALYHMWWDQNANTDLFPVQNPFMQAMAKAVGHNPSEYGLAPAWFEHWETLDRGQVLDTPMMPIPNLTINAFFPHLLGNNKKIGLV
jgi:hypothetical protein